MTNATPNQDADEVSEHAIAAQMLQELRRVLERTGRYDLSELERRLEGTRYQTTRRTLVRWMNGHAAPYTTDPVEALARAAGVDVTYLYVPEPEPAVKSWADDDADWRRIAELDEPIAYELTEQAVDVLTDDEPAPTQIEQPLPAWPSPPPAFLVLEPEVPPLDPDEPIPYMLTRQARRWLRDQQQVQDPQHEQRVARLLAASRYLS